MPGVTAADDGRDVLVCFIVEQLQTNGMKRSWQPSGLTHVLPVTAVQLSPLPVFRVSPFLSPIFWRESASQGGHEEREHAGMRSESTLNGHEACGARATKRDPVW